MTPGEIVALIKDLVILAAVAVLAWLLITFGKDLVKVSDMKAFQKQLAASQALETQWRSNQDNANLKRDQALAQVNASIAAQHAPVLLCRQPPTPHALPAVPAQTAGSGASPGGPDAGPGGDPGAPDPVDVRPAINAFEIKYEKPLADCQAVLDGWPTQR